MCLSLSASCPLVPDFSVKMCSFFKCGSKSKSQTSSGTQRCFLQRTDYRFLLWRGDTWLPTNCLQTHFSLNVLVLTFLPLGNIGLCFLEEHVGNEDTAFVAGLLLGMSLVAPDVACFLNRSSRSWSMAPLWTGGPWGC